MARRTPLAIDRTITLDINGSHQRIRLCTERVGLPPLLVVQAGPGLPVLHEVAKFQRLLNLERDFLVSYWEQRGCGAVPTHAAESVSLQQQVADLRAVLQWLSDETKQRILILGISLGATIALQAVEQELDRAKAVIAISPDAHTTSSDAAVYAFLLAQSVRPANRGLRRRVMKLGNPPYVNSRALQRRTVLLADLGTIERGKSFATLLREMLFGLIRYVWRRRRGQGAAEPESGPAKDDAGDRLARSVCQPAARDDSCSLRVRRAGRADSSGPREAIARDDCSLGQYGYRRPGGWSHGAFRSP
jgi:pimeloyl-ACP methyl ester carboxylesterase